MTEQKKKVKACKDTEYLFISAYLRAKEPQLLNAEKAGRMLGSLRARRRRGSGELPAVRCAGVGLDKALSDRRAAVFSLRWRRLRRRTALYRCFVCAMTITTPRRSSRPRPSG